MCLLPGRVHLLPALAVLIAGFAVGQTITTSPSTVLLNEQPGGTFVSTLLTINSTPATAVSVSAVTYNGGMWLSVSPSSLTTPGAVQVYAGPASSALPTGVYSGAIQITPSNPANAITVSVTLTVGNAPQGNPSLLASPAFLNFTAQAGGLVPAAQTITVTSAVSGLSFAASATTTDYYGWLQVSQPNATIPAALTISVNTAGMPAGLYSGNIRLTPVTGAVLDIPVSLTLTSTTSVSANVSAFQFYYQLGSFLPGSQIFTVTSTGSGVVQVNLTTTTTDMYNWLSVTPASAYTPQTITVSVQPNQLPAGTYHGNIRVSSASSATPALDVPVTLVVSPNALLTVGTTPTPFVYQSGSPLPPAQSVSIAATSGTLNYSVTTNTSNGTNWLAVAPLSGQVGQSAQALTIAVNPTSLATGNYTGSVVISAAGAANSPVTIPISLSVNTASTLTVNPPSVVINVQTGVAANQVLSQPLYVDSPGSSVTFTTSAIPTSCGAIWLHAFPATGTTPTLVTVSTDPSGLQAPQSCSGTVVITPAGGTSIQVPVTLKVSSTPLANVTPLYLNFSAPFDGDPTAAKTVSVSITDGSSVALTASALTTIGSSWLRVNPTTTSTPGTLNVTADPRYMSVGTYTGQITISSSAIGANSVIIPVTFKVTAVAGAVASPSSLTFTQVVGGASPAAQNVSLTSTSGSLSFGAATTSWVSLNQYEGYTPATLTVRVNGGNLPVGTYQGSISLSIPGAANNPLVIPVTLNVVSATAIAVDHSSLTFSYQQNGTAPAPQSLNVTSTGGAVGVAAAVASGGNWLAVSPGSGTTPAQFTVSVSPGSLAVGGYDGSITLTPAAGTAVTVNVHLDVTAAPVQVTAISAVSNAASGVRGAISPGEIVTITGTALGPAAGTGLVLENGHVSGTVAGTQVYFDEFPAPILYTSAQQVNTIVPYEIAGRNTVQVAVVYQGTRSANYTMQTAATAPGIFTATQNGRGQAAILNQDNTYNGGTSPSFPEEHGRIIQVFATGEGITNPANSTGGVTPDASYSPAASVTAIIGGVPAEVIYKGSAPGAVAGLSQVNIRVPQSVPSGDVSLAISIGGVMSQSGVTVAIK